jgi:hypothetical protein
MDPHGIKKKVETPVDQSKYENISVEDAKKVLNDHGIHVGGWTEHEEQVVEGVPLVDRQKDRLRKLEGILEHQIEQDKQLVADLHIQLQRLKSGGGG